MGVGVREREGKGVGFKREGEKGRRQSEAEALVIRGIYIDASYEEEEDTCGSYEEDTCVM
jgi:hypothetical protein